MKPTLHWVCHSPSLYNDFLFRALAESGDFDLRVHYLFAEWHEYSWNTSHGGYASRSFCRRPWDWTLLSSVLRDRKSVFLTACWQDPTCQIALAMLIILRRPYLIWGDTPASKHRNWMKERFRAMFLRTVFRKAAAVLGTGVPALKIFTQMGAPPERLINFPYCVDLDRFVPSGTHNDRPTIVFGTCCRLNRIKGLDLALGALALLSPSDRQRIRYRIAGSGPEESSLRDQVQTMGLTGCVEFCGWLQPDELPEFYRSLDAYLHPARFEPYGVAVVEALACGSPVLASDQTMAAVDRIVSGESGFLYRADDARDLRRVLEDFLSRDPGERARMRQEARRAALTWTPHHALESVTHLVRDVTNGKKEAAAGAMAGI